MQSRWWTCQFKRVCIYNAKDFNYVLNLRGLTARHKMEGLNASANSLVLWHVASSMACHSLQCIGHMHWYTWSTSWVASSIAPRNILHMKFGGAHNRICPTSGFLAHEYVSSGLATNAQNLIVMISQASFWVLLPQTRTLSIWNWSLAELSHVTMRTLMKHGTYSLPAHQQHNFYMTVVF